MQRVKNVFNYINSINRVVLFVIAVLAVGIFIALASSDDEPDTTANGSDVIVSEDNAVTPDSEGEDVVTGVVEDEGSEGTEDVPSELATTGPVASALATVSLGSLGYLYHRSRRDLADKNLG